MVNKIEEAILLKLTEVFGEGYNIYLEDSIQNLFFPNFTVTLETAVNLPLLGTRSKMDYGFLICYTPVSETTPKAEYIETGCKLMDNAEFVTGG